MIGKRFALVTMVTMVGVALFFHAQVVHGNMIEVATNSNVPPVAQPVTTSQPDLVVRDLQRWTTTTSPDPWVNMNLCNQGNAVATGFPVRINANGQTQFFSFATLVLAPGTCSGPQAWQYAMWGMDSRRVYTVTAVADPDNQIAESDESNNTTSTAFVAPASAPVDQPDLVLEDLKRTQDAQGSQWVSVTLCNRGADTTTSFPVRIIANGRTVLFPFPALHLSPGECLPNSWQYAMWNMDSTNTFAVNAVADPDNQVVESNENNNAVTATFAAPAQVPQPDLVLEDLKRVEDAGGNPSVSVKLCNRGAGIVTNFPVRIIANGRTSLFPFSALNLSSGQCSPTSIPYFQWNMDATNTFAVQATTDPDNQISESNENNNTITVTLAGVVPPVPGTVAVSPSQSTLYPEVGPGGNWITVVTADGSASVKMIVTARDVNRNLLAGKYVAMSWVRGSAYVTPTIVPLQSVTDASGVAMFQVSATTAGRAQLQASIIGLKLSSDFTITFVQPGFDQNVSLERSTFDIVGTRTLLADGTTHLARSRFIVRNSAGDPLRGKTVAVRTQRNNDSVHMFNAISDGDGAVNFDCASTQPGVATLTAFVDGREIPHANTADITFVMSSEVAADTIHFQLVGGDVVANGRDHAVVDVYVFDSMNRSLVNKEVVLNSLRGAVDTVRPATVYTNASGIARFIITSSTPGASVLKAVVEGVVSRDSVTARFISNADSQSNVPVSVSLTRSFIDGLIGPQGNAMHSSYIENPNNQLGLPISVVALDDVGNPVSGALVLLISSRSSDRIVPVHNNTTESNGMVGYYVRSSVPGALTLRATINGQRIANTFDAEFLALPQDSANTTSSPPPSNQTPASPPPAQHDDAASGQNQEPSAPPKPVVYAYGQPRMVMNLETPKVLELTKLITKEFGKARFKILFQRNMAAKLRWVRYVNAYVYGGYPVQDIIKSIRGNTKKIHPAFLWNVWKTSEDYNAK